VPSIPSISSIPSVPNIPSTQTQTKSGNTVSRPRQPGPQSQPSIPSTQNQTPVEIPVSVLSPRGGSSNFRVIKRSFEWYEYLSLGAPSSTASSPVCETKETKEPKKVTIPSQNPIWIKYCEEYEQRVLLEAANTITPPNSPIRFPADLPTFDINANKETIPSLDPLSSVI
jgi:hypothetical protein